MFNESDLYPPKERDKLFKNYNAKDKIINIIIKKGATWPNEIIGYTGMQPKTVYNNLAFLTIKGTIVRIKLKPDKKIPPIIKNRFPDLWDRNIKGRKIFKITFYIMPNKSFNDFKKEKVLEMD